MVRSASWRVPGQREASGSYEGQDTSVTTMNRMDRLVGCLLMFQSHSLLRAQDIAAKFEVSERTVYRDVQALCEVGVPIIAMPGEGYRLMPGYSLPPIMFLPDEARAVSLAVSMLSGMTQDGATKQAATTALEKIRAVLPKATLTQVEALQAVLGFYTVAKVPLSLDDPRLIQLQQAVQQRCVVRLHYQVPHTNDVTERDVEPLHITYIDNTWILSAYCRLRQDQRNFRLDRIDQLVVTNELFTPRGLILRHFPTEAIRVVVHFDPPVVRWVREAQHFSFVEVVAEDAATGTVMAYQVATFQVITGWLLNWGSQMEVLEPAELREEIAQAATRLLARHQ